MLNITIGIPTGQRTAQAIEVMKAWQEYGFNVCVLTWDQNTVDAVGPCLRSSYGIFIDHLIFDRQRRSFAVNQNKMMKNVPGWDVWVCGADDLWPGEQLDLRDRIELVASHAGDKLIWVGDGLFNAQPTHPIITRAMYEAEKGNIFDEGFLHNYTDTDLFMRMLLKKKVIQCMDIMLDHRHHMKTRTDKDDIYLAGDASMPLDAARYHNKYKNEPFNIYDSIEVFDIEETETE